MQLILQKLFRAMVTRISRNSTVNNFSKPSVCAMMPGPLRKQMRKSMRLTRIESWLAKASMDTARKHRATTSSPDRTKILLKKLFRAIDCDNFVQFLSLETNLASRWEGVRLPRASGKSPGFPGSSPKLPRKFFSDFPGSSLSVELNSNPGVPREFPELPRKFLKLPRKFRDFPGGQPLSLGSLTPSPDSQKLSLILRK